MASRCVNNTPPLPTLPPLLTCITHTDSSPPISSLPTHHHSTLTDRQEKPHLHFGFHNTTRSSRIVTADPKWPTHNTALAFCVEACCVCVFPRANPILWGKKKTNVMFLFFAFVVVSLALLNRVSGGGAYCKLSVIASLSTSASFVFTFGSCLPLVSIS